MTKGARIAIVAGIIIAIATGATVAAVSAPSGPQPPADNENGNATDDGPRQFVVELNESLSVDAVE